MICRSSSFRKAVRATLVLVPLFGLHFFLVLYQPQSGQCATLEGYTFLSYSMDGLQLQRDWNACTSETQRDCFTVRSAQLYNAARDQFRSYGCRRQESPHICGAEGDPNHYATVYPVTKPFHFKKPSPGSIFTNPTLIELRQEIGQYHWQRGAVTSFSALARSVRQS
ncbi:hypothetical protein AVEN_189015-1 [Araneus ventricosus]|uniref:Uncharacterized protein n=1 Tax=Araneus ventricosus TaxID=182803 RepID=A0A4Y2QJ20_ARAVE|nr:hypothetical protein AVEN_189015-1 [Araneus ventricosus]